MTVYYTVIGDSAATTAADIIPFTFGANEIRTLTDEAGEPWFVAKDVCDVLGIRSDSITYILDSDETMKDDSNTIGVAASHKLLFINESGLYSLILKSRKPEAKAFKKWVTSEVLPSIRKRGGYMIAKDTETPEEIISRAAALTQDAIKSRDR